MLRPQGLASGLGSLWVSVSNVNSVVRIDEVTDVVQALIPETPTPLHAANRIHGWGCLGVESPRRKRSPSTRTNTS